jgi:ABC-type maltose transport system permease subunit
MPEPFLLLPYTHVICYTRFEPFGRKRNITNYLIFSWIGVLLGKLLVSQLVKKFPTFNRTRRLITVFTTTRYMSIPSAR